MHTFADDIELFAAFNRGDSRAFEILYNRHFNSVFYFARRFVDNIATAEDITTDAFIKVWERRSDFSNVHKLTSFLYISTRNACINEVNANKRHSKSNQELQQLLLQSDEESKAKQQLVAAIYQHIYTELEKLPPQEREVFRLAFVEGLSNEEIAAQLHINNQSVRNYKARALKTLRGTITDTDLLQLLLLLLLWKD